MLVGKNSYESFEAAVREALKAHRDNKLAWYGKKLKQTSAEPAVSAFQDGIGHVVNTVRTWLSRSRRCYSCEGDDSCDGPDPETEEGLQRELWDRWRVQADGSSTQAPEKVTTRAAPLDQ